jgi:hypothetical protein
VDRKVRKGVSLERNSAGSEMVVCDQAWKEGGREVGVTAGSRGPQYVHVDVLLSVRGRVLLGERVDKGMSSGDDRAGGGETDEERYGMNACEGYCERGSIWLGGLRVLGVCSRFVVFANPQCYICCCLLALDPIPIWGLPRIACSFYSGMLIILA